MSRARPYAVALGVVLALTAGALVFLGSREFIGYDSYWHVFIARQDRWPNFWREVRDNAHPPLFYLMLRLSAYWLGPHMLVYRLVQGDESIVIEFAPVASTPSDRPVPQQLEFDTSGFVQMELLGLESGEDE